MDSFIIFSILWIALALAVALVLSKVMKIIHFPNVTGFLIGGILIGPWVFGLVIQQNEAVTNIVSSFGWIMGVNGQIGQFVCGAVFQSFLNSSRGPAQKIPFAPLSRSVARSGSFQISQ